MVNIEWILSLGIVLLKLIVVLLVTIGTIIISQLILKRWLWPTIKKTKAADKIFRLLESILLSFIILQGTQVAVKIFSEVFSLYTGLIDNFFFLLYWSIGTYTIINLISIASDWYLSREPIRDLEEINHQAIRYIQYLSQLIFGFLAIIILLERFGVTTASLHQSLTALGIGGIIIGLAAQSTLADFISGVAISIDRPFKIGDRILIEKLNTWGDVIEISWRSTRILTRDNRQVAIPNSVIGKELITNYSMPDRMFRVETFVIISYGPDIEYVRNLILEALAHEDWIMQDKPIQALLFDFTEFGVKFKVRCWIENFTETKISEDRLNTAIYKALTNAGIAVPALHIIIQFVGQENKGTVSKEDNDFRN
ncbi:MAG: mechanosensitive ion channel family protein [Methanosarcina sp.]